MLERRPGEDTLLCELETRLKGEMVERQKRIVIDEISTSDVGRHEEKSTHLFVTLISHKLA